MNYYSAYSYNSSSPKSSISNQRAFGSFYNSPKTETQKPLSFTTKLKNENPRYATKSERVADSPLDKRLSKNRDYSASRVQTFSSTHSGFYDPERDDDKRTSFDPYRTSQNFGQTSSVRNISASPLSRSVYLRDTNKEDSNILTRKKNDYDNINLRTLETRPYTAKNSDSRDRYDDTNYKKGTVTYYPLDEFISKYSPTKTVGTSSYSRTEKTEPYKSSLTLSRVMANSPGRPPSATMKTSGIYDSDKTPTHSNSPKNNNYMDRFNSSSNNNDTNTRIQRLLNNTPQFEYKRYESREVTDYEKPLLTRSEMNFRKTFTKTPELELESPSSYYKNNRLDTKEKEKNTLSSSQIYKAEEKLSLDSFVTKVERGNMTRSFAFEEKLEYKGRESRNGYGTSTTEERSLYSTPSKDSPYKTQQKESRFFKTQEKSPQDSELSYSAEVLRYGKSTRPSSARNEESTDGSQEEDNTSFVYYITNLEKHLKRYDDRDYFTQIYKEHFQQSFQSMKFCKYMRPTDARVLSKKKVYLTKKDIYRNKKTLIFDLDETLIHCNDSPMKRSDVKLPIQFPGGETIQAGINVRPYAIECLKELSQHFEVIVFTASHKSYATVVLDYLDPHKQYIQHRLFRDSCVYTDEGVYVKDLRVIANRNLQDMILVDNAAYSFGFQIDNGVPIIPFYENKNDRELKDLIPFLKTLAKVPDVREVLKKTFKMHLYSKYNSQEDVKGDLFFRN